MIRALESAGDHSLHTMEVVSALGFSRQEVRRAAPEVREVLGALALLGFVQELPGSRWRIVPRSRRALRSREPGPRAPSPRAPRLTRREGDAEADASGWVSMTTRGFAFVALEDGREVFVPPRALAGALHRDRVRVRLSKSEKGLDGEVVEILERGMRRVGGTLVRIHGGLFVRTTDARLPELFAVEGALPLEIRPGQEVLARLADEVMPPRELPAVRVLRSLGARGSVEAEIAKLRAREGIEEEFPDEVLAEASAFASGLDPSEFERREDLRGFAFLTIDPKDARDHDDAVWAARTRDGYRVIVAIADVSHYVREGTAIDAEARVRGCSIYLPDRAIPMLPPELSSDLASLLPNEDRLTLAVDVSLTKAGVVRSFRFVEGVMQSRARLSYEAVARTLGLSEAGPAEADPSEAKEPSSEADAHAPALRVLLEISSRLRARRERRGALGFDLPEAKILLDEAGEPRDVVPQKADPGVKRAYELIEDLMLLANETVAEELSRRHLPALFRVHGTPDPMKVQRFAEVAESLGFAVGDLSEPTPKALAALLRTLETDRRGPILSSLLLRAMQQATYQIDDIGHFALAAQHYVHFTSPIRRYPDVTVHRIVRALARGETLDPERLAEELQPIAAGVSRTERRAMLVEREVQALYRTILLRPRVGDRFEGTISGVAERGVFVTLASPFVEVKVPIERVAGEPEQAEPTEPTEPPRKPGRRPRDEPRAWSEAFELDRLGIALVGVRSGIRLRLGDKIRVRIDEASLERREILATRLADPARARAASRGRSTREKGERDASRSAKQKRDAKGSSRAPSPRARRSRDEAKPRKAKRR